MEKNPAIPLKHILEAIDGIENTVVGLSFETYVETWHIRHAVQRGLEIISEASRRIPDDVTGQYPDINWLQVRGIGNILRHEYHNIQDEVIWDVVKRHLPPLEVAIRVMLTELD